VTRPLYRRKRTWSAIILLGMAALAIHFRTEIIAFFSGVGWEDIRQGVLASGPLAPLVCMLLLAFFTIFFLPTTLVAILIALLYGPWLGLPICLAGFGLGMGISFLVSRYLLHEWIERRIGDTKLYGYIEEHMRRDGWKLVVFTRILPINPFAFLNYAYGLTSISFWRFLAASLAGISPNILALLWTTHAAGQLATGQMDWRILILLFAGAGLFAVLAWLPRLLRRKTQLADLPIAEEAAADPEA
jgi:uncharacterized membrane protein YdjX (TVP38/TMEM64 family)